MHELRSTQRDRVRAATFLAAIYSLSMRYLRELDVGGLCEERGLGEILLREERLNRHI